MVGEEWAWAHPVMDTAGQPTVVVDNGHVFYSQAWRPYYPFEFPNLPNRLAAVDSTKDIVGFVGKYGVLGYRKLNGDDSTEVYTVGDPVDWFLLQAKTVRFALQVLNAVHEGKSDEQLKSLIYRNQIQIPLKTFITEASVTTETKTHCFAEGSEAVLRPVVQPGQWEGKHKALAVSIVSHLVNINTVGVRRVIGVKSSDAMPVVPFQFAQQYSAGSLIGAIWHMVGDAAINTSGKGTRICRECGLPFIVTDNRQKFCPGDKFSSESLCGTRYRVRQHRRNGKEREANE